MQIVDTKTKFGSLLPVFVGMLVELSHKQEIKIGIKTTYRLSQNLAVTLYHTNLSSNVDSDLNENSGGLTDLAKK